jgi:hypothetical protein
VALHEDSGHDLPICCAVVSAISPNNVWRNNVDQARAILMAVGDEVDSTPISTYDGGRKAREILRGVREPRVGKSTERQRVAFTWAKAPKTAAFFVLLLDPTDPEAVVVDGHAFNITRNERAPIDSVPQLAGRRYTQAANAYRDAARILGTTPSAVQATTWLAWRRIHDTHLNGSDPDLSAYDAHHSHIED